MTKSTTVQWLSKAVSQAARSAKFCVTGSLPGVDPGLEVEGLPPVKLPLRGNAATRLVAHCHTAPYGKGTQTLVDTKVRKTVELDADDVSLGDDWNSAIAEATRTVAAELGLPAEQLEARLYKLLVYEKGGFFLPHRDSEKHDRMLASLIVVLPSPFEGGALVVRHGSQEQVLKFEEAARGNAPCYAAFYADCEHEVDRVTRGRRLCLSYNLVLNRATRSAGAKSGATSDALADSMKSWVATQPARPLVFALEHHYSQRGLSLDLLKGADRQLADLIVPAADGADCLVHLAQVTRHLLQFADDGSLAEECWGYSRRSRSRRPRRQTIEIGETYEDDLSGTEWVDAGGRKQPWGEIPFDLPAIVSSVPLDDWKPTSEDFEGYTGNAGNTLDRWYHRSAIVVWAREHHFDVIASSGADQCLPLFGSMAARLKKTPASRREQARLDCLRFARAIIDRWPRRVPGYARSEAAPYRDFTKQLLSLHDRDTIATFLSTIAERDSQLGLRSFVVSACRKFGWSAFDQELTQLLSAPPRSRNNSREEIPHRDLEWLSAYCCDRTDDPDRSALAGELCALAVGRFCEPDPPQSGYYSYRRGRTVSAASLPLLLKALMACGRDEDLSRVIAFVQESPDDFRLHECQAPALKSLIPWSQERFGSVHPQLASWLDSVRQQLESATAQQPSPPSDWARPADVRCDCQYCAELRTFLADPAQEVGRIPASEDNRQHLIGVIHRRRFDVKHDVERKGRPYSLVLSKTTESYQQALKQYQADRKLLESLPKGS